MDYRKNCVSITPLHLLGLLGNTAMACVIAMTSCAALAQSKSLRVLVDAGYQARSQRFLNDLTKHLEPEARAIVRFESFVVASQKVPSVLRGAEWDLAILSTGTLASTDARLSLAAFEMPFVHASSSTTMEFQRSPHGKAALAAMAKQGFTGLVYLNSGMSLVVTKAPIKSPKDFEYGRKIAVSSAAQHQTLRTLGWSTVQLPGGEIITALERGVVDSALIDSAGANSWIYRPHSSYMIADSVKAQVAIVIARDASWEQLPFVHRAMVADAAIAASQEMDREVLQAESALFDKMRSAGLLIKFRKDDAERATRDWIQKQPALLRNDYSSLYNQIKAGSPKPSTKPIPAQKDGQLGHIYFATTREDTGSSQIRYRFGDARTNIVKCGQIVFPAGSRKSTALALQGQVTADNAACGIKVSEVLRSSERMLIFIHGFNNRFAEAAERAALLKEALGNTTEVVLWSWPSKRDGLEGHYNYDKESVTGSARLSLGRFLKALQKGGNGKPLDVLAHSMGGWHIIGALQDVLDDADSPRLANLALAAPDVPRDEFTLSLDEIRRVADRVTLYACRSDAALQFSQLINAFPRAGTGGADTIIVSQTLESIDVEGRLLSSNHSYVFEAGKVLADLTRMVTKRSGAESRGLRKQPKPPWHYWVFL